MNKSKVSINYFKIIILILGIGFLNQLNAQDTLSPKGRFLRYKIIDGDTFPVYTYDEVIIKDLRDDEAQKKYLRLVRNVKKTLPYAKLAAFRLQMMEDNLNQIKTKRARERYIKATEKEIKKEFMAELKNLSVTQGKLLLKLIYRETGKSTHDILQSYRGNVTSIFWQTMAKFYNADTKVTYDPVEDYQIEHIIKSLEIEDP